MTSQQLIETQRAKQVPFQRIDNRRTPTPVEIRLAILAALEDDYNNPNTPQIPVHIYPLLREAVARANRGDFQ